jgi:hypothetical protein
MKAFTGCTFRAWTFRCATLAGRWLGLGPICRVEAGQVFHTGAQTGQVFHTGAQAGQVFHTGAQAGQVLH